MDENPSIMFGRNTMMVGLEEMDDGALKVYVGARWKNIYMILDDEAEKDKARRAWSYGGHVFMPVPAPEQLFYDAPPLSEAPTKGTT